MSTRIIDLPDAPTLDNGSVLLLVVPTVLTVNGCTGNQAFFNGNYHMAADGVYYKEDDGFYYNTNNGPADVTQGPSLKKYQLPTHYQNLGPQGHEVQTIIYQTRYGLFAPPINPGNVEAGLWFQSVGYPSEPLGVNSTFALYNYSQGSGISLPTISTATGNYNQTFKTTVGAVLNLAPFVNTWPDDVSASGNSLTEVYNLGVVNSINLQSGRPFNVGGNKVIGDQQAAIADATTLTAVARLNDILAALRAHGLIAT